MPGQFRVGVTRDFLGTDGRVAFGDIGLSLLDRQPGLSWEFLAEDTRELRADQVRRYDALLVLAPRVTAATLEGAERLAVVARFGVGYDTVDVPACTRNGVLLTITPDGVRRPVATAAMAFLLALSHKLLIKDRLTREGRWSEKLDHMGMGLTGRTLGLIGLGNIGRELCSLSRPFGMRLVAYDPHVEPEAAATAGVERMPLETLLRESDFVCVCCALTPETRHLLDAGRLASMKPTAYLINVARGPIVDQAALADALRAGKIQGAGLDVFETEPVDPGDPILALENVIVAPHALCWTDECFRGNGVSACESILEVAAGRIPGPVVNRDVIGQPLLVEKLRRIAEGARTAPS
jgi:phosphoglycerate dehydrogenase-like enzyme